jgi:hypothetical protein
MVSSITPQVDGKSVTASLFSAILNMSGREMVTEPKALARNRDRTRIPPSNNKTQTRRLPLFISVSIFRPFLFHAANFSRIKIPSSAE